MQVISSVADFVSARNAVRGALGFVPTMGYLHEGHLTLVRHARADNDAVAVSIFVNPTQFGPSEDFAAYPRDPERDLAMLRKEKVDLVFMPAPADMYPPGCDSWVEVKAVTEPLEGVRRPTHFRGVATVVTKLFNIVRPDRAYFGWKDAQQVLTIQKMVRDLNMPLEIVGVPTVREADGLAMSSRNTYLNPAERRAAVALSRSLRLAEKLWSEGERNAGVLRQRVMDMIRNEPLARIDYVSVASPDSLRELDQIKGSAFVLLAVYVGKTRLIDNVLLA